MLRADLERRQLAGAVLDDRAPARIAFPGDDVLDRRAPAHGLLDGLAHRQPVPAAQRVVRGDHDLGLRVLQPLHTAGAAKPEKSGIWIAPMCAHACEATATSGHMGR